MQVLTEEWRPIKDYDGLYEVSNQGRIKSLGREQIVHRTYGLVKRWLAGRIMRTLFKRKTRIREHVVGLYDYEGTHKYHEVSRLVYEAFSGPITDGYMVVHIDHRLQNTPGNLTLSLHHSNGAKRLAE